MWYNPHVPFAFGNLAPESKVVQSDQEYLKPYKDSVDGINRQMERLPTRDDLMFQYTTDAHNFAKDKGIGLAGDFSAQLLGELSGDAPGAGLTVMKNLGFNDGSGVFNYDYKAEMGRLRDDLGRASTAHNTAFGERADNTARQTQAYGQMQGGNFFGGMMNEGYSDPWSGQVVGSNDANSETKTMGGLGGLGGIKTNAQPDFASYNSTWAPQARQHRAGSWAGGW